MEKEKILEVIKKHRDEGLGYPDIAKKLNAAGMKTARGLPFTTQSTRYLVIKRLEERVPQRKIITTLPSPSGPIVLSAGSDRVPPLRIEARAPLSLMPRAPTEEKLEMAAKILSIKDLSIAKRAEMAVYLIMY